MKTYLMSARFLGIAISVACLTASRGAALAGPPCEPFERLELTTETSSGTATTVFQISAGAAGHNILGPEIAARYVGREDITAAAITRGVWCASSAEATGASEARLSAGTTEPSPTPTLCIGEDLFVVECPDGTGNGTYYPVHDGDSCVSTSLGGVVVVECGESRALVLDEGQAIAESNAAHVTEEMLARMAALRDLVSSTARLSNVNFDFRDELVDSLHVLPASSYNTIMSEIQSALDRGVDIPDLEKLLTYVPEPPPPRSLHTQLRIAQRQFAQQLSLVAGLSDTSALSPSQIRAFHQRFVSRAQILDQKLGEGTDGALDFVRAEMNDTVWDLASLSRFSPSYREARAAYESLLGSYSRQGVFPSETGAPGQVRLSTRLTADNLDDRFFGADLRTFINDTAAEATIPQEGAAAIDMAAWADHAYSVGHIDQAYRLFDRAATLVDYAQGGSFPAALSPKAQEQYGAEIGPDVGPDTFLGYELIQVANELAQHDLATDPARAAEYERARAMIRDAQTTQNLDDQLQLLEGAWGIADEVGGFGHMPANDHIDPLNPYGFRAGVDTPGHERLTQAMRYGEAVRAIVATDTTPDRATRDALLDYAELTIEVADGHYLDGEQGEGDHAVSTTLQLIDMALDFVPVASNVKDAVVVFTGVNPITGEQVSDTERAMTAGTMLVPGFLAGGAKALIKTVKHLDTIAALGRRGADAADDLAQSVRRADRELSENLPVPCADLTTAPIRGPPNAATPPLNGSSSPCDTAGAVTAEIADAAEENLKKLQRGEVGFGVAPRNDFRKTYHDHYDHYDRGEEIGQVHHAVEQQVLRNYEGLFTKEEIHSLQNLRGVPSGPEGSQLHQSKIRVEWNKFYRWLDDNNITPTRELFIKKAKKIDDDYGHLFIPPIR